MPNHDGTGPREGCCKNNEEKIQGQGKGCGCGEQKHHRHGGQDHCCHNGEGHRHHGERGGREGGCCKNKKD